MWMQILKASDFWYSVLGRLLSLRGTAWAGGSTLPAVDLGKSRLGPRPVGISVHTGVGCTSRIHSDFQSVHVEKKKHADLSAAISHVD